ncbi:MAG: Lrp/AsnC family transcriptional regulator [Desulfobacterales bacterium]|nr:Lrp/AsnC family transcriptional regulator [Desulfobacterales bacterium]
MKIDKTNINIIKHLRDGRKSYKKIAEDLNITENTVRSRVNKLIEDKVLDITGLVDAEAIPGHQEVIFGVKLDDMDLLKKGDEFSSLRGVSSVSIVTGRYDLIIRVLLNENLTLLQFITEQVTKIDGVKSVESFVVYKGFNLKTPYIL